LSVLKACRFTQTLSEATRQIVAATMISTHGTQRRQPVGRGAGELSGDIRLSLSTCWCNSPVTLDIAASCSGLGSVFARVQAHLIRWG
jgi:hypothetical protein